MKNIDAIARAVLVVLFSYGLALGGTFNGLIEPQFRIISLVMIVLVVGGWLVIHWRRGWVWHRTPLDPVFILWEVAFAVSILANTETWRQSATGLWFMGLYIGVWYILQDVIANKGIKRETVVDGVLFSGLIVLIFGYLQVYMSLASGAGLPRPVSTLGNANALGAFLVVLCPLAVGNLLAVRSQWGQGILVVYSSLAILLLLLTGSRGAWLGLGASVVAGGALLLAQHDLLSWSRLRQWWGSQTTQSKLFVAFAIGVILIVGVILAVLLVRSLDDPGRDVGLRTYLYDAALQLFAEKPLTGQGLFTFGHYLPRFSSIPPDRPHSHAHNALLHIAAELGLPGLIALGATLVVMIITMRRNWRDSHGRDQTALIGAIASVVGFAVHHLTDTPAMMPVIALSGLVALILAMAPVDAQTLTARWRKFGHPVAMAGLWIVLVAAGLWATSVYNDYLAILRTVVQSPDGETYLTAAGQLQSVIDAEPALSLYRGQQAYLLGLAANEGDLHAGLEAVEAYERVVQMDSYSATDWANLSVLYWNSGELEKGFEAMQQAAELAPESWPLQYDLGLYAEAMDKDDVARAAYEQALIADPDADLHPAWGQTALQAEIYSDPEQRSTLGQIVVLMENGAPQEAFNLWRDQLLHVKSVPNYIVRTLVALQLNDLAPAIAWYGDAQFIAKTAEDRAWVHLGMARLAPHNGAPEMVEGELEAARAFLRRGILDADFPEAASMYYGQFLRQALPRQFLPQVYYPLDDPVLLHLLEDT